MPAQVQAGFLASLFGAGDQVYAEDSIGTEKPLQFNHNSQNLALLEANVSSASIFQARNDKKDVEDTVIDSNTNIVSDNALLSAVGPMGVSGGKDIPDSSLEDISVYVVRKGDSISQIADMFKVSTNTILWANDMKKGEKLVEGEVLFILPISGVKHIVAKGETLKSIAQKYKADLQDITSFNGITTSTKLAVGDELIIPDGEISVDGPVKTNGNNKTYSPKSSLKNIAGYFISPIASYTKTQGLHGKNAVDLAAPMGTPVYAAASGTVLLARMGWNGAYGNMVIIQHPNGTKTLYSHLLKLGTSSGQSVSRGEVIGYVGNSGRVRAARGGNGAHLHFEVYGAKNPGVDRSWTN